MKLADLLDLEWLLSDAAPGGAERLAAAKGAAALACRGRGVEPAAARARLDGDRGLREALAAALVQTARDRGEELPGRRIAHALDLVGWSLIAAGLVLGGSTARVVLAYDGTTPVNVLHFALVFGGLQIVLLVALVAFLVRARISRAEPGPGLLHRPAAWLVQRALGARGRAAAELLRTLRTRASRHAELERWTLFALVQRFGVAFNAAALIVAIALIAGTDLVFSWSTTLDLVADDIHAFARTVALPWSLVWPDAVPSADAVRASQWVRMPGSFVSNQGLAAVQPLASSWWRFLVALLITYGLLPRVLALAFGVRRVRAWLRAASFDDAACHRLFDRLLPVPTAWSGPDPASVRGEAPAAHPDQPQSPHAPTAPGAAVMTLAWGSLAAQREGIAQLVRARFAHEQSGSFAVGGASLDDDAAALSAIRDARPPRAIVCFAAGQPPTADVLAFLRDLRGALGAGRPIVVLSIETPTPGRFVDALPEELAIWRRSLGTLGDAQLWLETLEASP